MSTPRTSSRVRVTAPVLVAVVGTFALAGAAFVLSFTALRDLAVLAGVPETQAWLWPLVVDGVILEATVSVVALRNATATARRFAWLLLTGGAAVSVAANITHAVLVADARVPALIAAAVASVPPLTLLAMTHLTVELIRNTEPAHPQPGPDVVPEARALPAPASSQAPALAGLPGPEAEAAGPVPDSEEASAGVDVAVLGREEKIAQAVAWAADEVPQREIARRLSVHPTTVGRWLSAPERSQETAKEPS
ncbi:DUF2637 domain-containing protein [Kocuria carniphila]|uniref:DUF2637 domain-containing protein n=1 Tax=Kocuria carniphila TaxID=262208 RepID=A0ABV3V507_9MICC